MVDQLMDVLGYFGTLVPDVAEQVIEVPEISPQDGLNWLNSWWKCQPFLFPSSRLLTIRFRIVVCLAMEVLKVYPQDRIQQRFAEQNVDRSLQGFTPRTRFNSVLRSRTWISSRVYAQDKSQQRFAEQNVDLFKGLRPGQESTAFCGAEHESLHDLRAGQDSTAFWGEECGTLQGLRP